MKYGLTAIVAAAAIAVAASAADSPAVYYSARNGADADGSPEYVQTFRLSGIPRGTVMLAFNQFARRMRTADAADTLTEVVPGYYTVRSPGLAADTASISVITRGTLSSVCYEPDGMHLVLADGSVVPLRVRRFDILGDAAACAKMPSADSVWRRNMEIGLPQTADVYAVVPSFKKVTRGDGQSDVDLSNPVFEDMPGAEPEEYFMNIGEGRITVRAPKAMWPRLRRVIAHRFGTGVKSMPDAVIEDRPDMRYRGLMIDPVRNFQPASEIHRVIDLMALYGFNVLHFHLTDDEAWRLEIPALPELTAIGSRRGYASDYSTAGYLPQIFAGDGNPDSRAGTANGFYTRADMISILQHADSLGIRVLPEIESPGHARAAIYALKGREGFELAEEGDTSRYTSAQAFHDNIMNPALEGPYRLMDVVADELISIYREAGVELPAIHIGGDEVPRHAWDGSPAVAAMMRRDSLADQKAVHAAFVRRVAQSYARKGVRISGWQEVAHGHSEDYDSVMRPMVFSVNCWSTLPSHGHGSVTTDIARDGYPVVLSNVDHFYLDMTYSAHPSERGLSWGGNVDEFDALAGYPRELCPVDGADIAGIQAQVFAETIRGTDGLETMLLPKMLGVAERAWNNDSTYTESQFNSVIVREIPKWQAGGYAYHVRQPGARVTGDVLEVNTTYADSVIRYTTDGSEPDSGSAIVSGSVTLPAGVHQVRQRQWVGDIASPSTIVFIP